MGHLQPPRLAGHPRPLAGRPPGPAPAGGRAVPLQPPQPRGGAGAAALRPGPGLRLQPLLPLAGGLLTGKYAPGEAPPANSRAAWNAGTARRAQEARLQRLVAGVAEVAAGLGRPLSQVALNWVAAQPGVTSPIIGPRTLEQLQDNAGALEWDLDEGTVAQLTRLADPGT